MVITTLDFTTMNKVTRKMLSLGGRKVLTKRVLFQCTDWLACFMRMAKPHKLKSGTKAVLTHQPAMVESLGA